MGTYKPQDFSEMLGVSVKTLQRWDREGILKAHRTPTDRRYYTQEQYIEYMNKSVKNGSETIQELVKSIDIVEEFTNENNIDTKGVFKAIRNVVEGGDYIE